MDPSPAQMAAQMAAMAAHQPDRRTAGQMLADTAEVHAALASRWEPTVPPATYVQLMTWAAAEISSSRAAAPALTQALRTAKDALAAAEDRIRQLEQQAVADAHQSALVSWDQQQLISNLQEQLANLQADEGSEDRARQQREITQLEQNAAAARAQGAQISMTLDRAIMAMQTAKELANSLLNL